MRLIVIAADILKCKAAMKASSGAFVAILPVMKGKHMKYYIHSQKIVSYVERVAMIRLLAVTHMGHASRMSLV